MKFIKTLKIDINKNNFEIIPSVQYDSNTRYLHVYLLNNSLPFDITGCSVKIAGMKADNTEIFNNCNIIDYKKGFIEIELTEQMNAAAGSVECELKIYSADGVLTTKTFIINISKSVTRAANITSSNEFNALTDALNKVQGIDNKADKVEVEEKFEEFGSQLDTKANLNSVFTMANMGQDVKEAMTGGSVAVVGRYSVLSETIVDKQVRWDKTDFIEGDFKELFSGYVNKSIIVQTDNLPDISSMQYTDNTSGRTAIIPLVSGKRYKVKISGTHNRFRIGILNNEVVNDSNNNNFDTPIFVNDNESYCEFTNTTNGKYALICVSNQNEEPSMSVYCLDDVKKQLKDVNVDGNSITSQSINTDSIKSFVPLYSKITNLTYKKIAIYFDTSALPAIQNMGYTATDSGRSIVFPVAYGQKYNIKVTGTHNRFRIGLTNNEINYNASNVGIDTPIFAGDDTKNEYTFINTSNNAKYAIVTFSNQNEEPEFNVITGEYKYKLSEEIEINDSSQEILYTPKHLNSYDGINGKLTDDYTVSELYNLYDELISKYPNEITKTLLGKDQSDTYDIYKYEIKPKFAEAKIIIGTGVHGYTRATNYGDPAIHVMAFYEFIKDLLENWRKDKYLEFLKTNIHFVIMPLCNPWGFEKGSRGNSRGVDLNRNFDNNWENTAIGEGTENYKGTSPFSEKETQYIKQVVESNLDAIAYYDFHSMANKGKEMYWVGVANSADSKCSKMLYKSLNVVNRDINANITIDYYNNPSSYPWAESKGIPSCNPEILAFPTDLTPQEVMFYCTQHWGDLIYKHCYEYLYNRKY